MRQLIIFLSISFLFVIKITAQENVKIKMKSPSILLTGSASLHIDPDAIEFKLSLRDKTMEDSIVSVKTQIRNLIGRLYDIGIENFTISELLSSESKERTYGNYEFKLYVKKPFLAEEIIEVLENEIKASYMIINADCQSCDSLKNEVKKLAVQNAKDKAVLILSKLNKKCGDPLKVIETDNTYATNIAIEYQPDREYNRINGLDYRKYKSCTFVYFSEITVKFKIE